MNCLGNKHVRWERAPDASARPGRAGRRWCQRGRPWSCQAADHLPAPGKGDPPVGSAWSPVHARHHDAVPSRSKLPGSPSLGPRSPTVLGPDHSRITQTVNVQLIYEPLRRGVWTASFLPYAQDVDSILPGNRPAICRAVPGIPSIARRAHSCAAHLHKSSTGLCTETPARPADGKLVDQGRCSCGRSATLDGSGASQVASQKGGRLLRVHRHSAARVSVTGPSAAYIRRSPRTRKGPCSAARMLVGTSGCSPGTPGAW